MDGMLRGLRTCILGAALVVSAACASGGSDADPGLSSQAVSAPATDTIAVSVTPASASASRVLLIGDSTLLAVGRYRALAAFRGFEAVYNAESCRTLGVPSCGDPPVPLNAVETINAAEGTYDMVVIMAGYDEWWISFPTSFDKVVEVSRAKGADHIIWLNYPEGVGYTAPDGSTANEAFVKNNQTLRDKVASGNFPDVVLADWFGYTAAARQSPSVTPRGTTQQWLTDDGIHLTDEGAYAVADYISRTIAHIEGRPCPAPWEPDGTIDDPCPSPDGHSPVVDVWAIYRET
jgi:hypothetical protein